MSEGRLAGRINLTPVGPTYWNNHPDALKEACYQAKLQMGRYLVRREHRRWFGQVWAVYRYTN